MEIYLVGGAIRDELLGLPVTERDWVVVGATPEAMIAQGFKPVGKDFPVFLHPETHEEYALARTERKIAKGYQGFHFYCDPDVTLIDDLKRRDLTINAMARSLTGELIDPYHGQEDLKAKRFAHVSPAFAEDPVRILRLARFACKLDDFTVSPTTNQLMQHMVDNGEVDALIAERVWKEFEKALLSKNPARFFQVLAACHALAKLWPDILLDDAHNNVLTAACRTSPSGPIRFAALLSHLDTQTVKKVCQRYRVPKGYKDLALLVSRQISAYHQLDITEPTSILDVLKSTDALRKPERFQQFLTVCDLQQQSNQESLASPLLTSPLLASLSVLKNLDHRHLVNQGLSGTDFADALQAEQLKALQHMLHK